MLLGYNTNIQTHTHTIQFTTYCNSIGSPSIYVVKMSIMGDIYGHTMHPDGYDHWLPKLRDPSKLLHHADSRLD